MTKKTNLLMLILTLLPTLAWGDNGQWLWLGHPGTPTPTCQVNATLPLSPTVALAKGALEQGGRGRTVRQRADAAQRLGDG